MLRVGRVFFLASAFLQPAVLALIKYGTDTSASHHSESKAHGPDWSPKRSVTQQQQVDWKRIAGPGKHLEL